MELELSAHEFVGVENIAFEMAAHAFAALLGVEPSSLRTNSFVLN